jgi:rod shape-determining protein MreC
VKTGSAYSYTSIVLAAAVSVGLVLWRPAAAEVVYPVERAKHTFVNKVWSRVVGAFRGSAAQAENIRLKREVASLSVLRADLERLEMENAKLRRQIEYAQRSPSSWVAASVISTCGAASTGERIRVDKGSLAGIKEAAAVVVPEGLVGRVVSVSPHTCEIALVTDPSVKVACEVQTGSDRSVYGILSGGDDDMLTLNHVTGASTAPARSRVITSGRGGVFPRGIEVGYLIGLREDGSNLSRTGEILPAVDFSNIEDVFIRREK